MQALSLISYVLLAIKPALAQATTPATGGDIPWLWIIVIVVALAAAIWWYLNGNVRADLPLMTSFDLRGVHRTCDAA